MANCHQQGACHHRHSVAEYFIRQVAAQNRGDVHQRTVGAEQGVSMVIFVLELVGEIQDQQGTHAIKAEIFPDLQCNDVINGAGL
ncbi:hypothetical protein D3C78_1669230 [compost metagenome]